MADVMLPGPDDLVFGVVQELVPVGQPPSHPGDHEQNREHVRREAHGFVDYAAVEVNVWVEFPLDEVWVTQCDFLELDGNLDQLLFASDLEHFVRYLFDDFGPRVVVFVDSVPKPIQQSFFLFHTFDKFGDILLFADRLKHPQNSLVGSSMFGTIKCASGPSNSSIDINSGRGEMPDGGSGAVEFMLSMQNEEHLERVDQFGVRFEVGLVEFIQHVEETLDVAGVLWGIVVLSADSVAEGVGGDCRHTAQQSVDLLVSDGFVFVDGFADEAGVLLGVQSREGGHRAADDSHGVSIIAEGIHHRQQILVDEGMVHDLFAEEAEFLLGGQFAPDNEVGHFQERALFGKNFDGVATVLQNASVAIDVADLGSAGNGVHVAGIIAPQNLALVAQLGQVGRFQKTAVGVQLMGLARP